MKKVFAALSILGFFTLTSCGPSAEEEKKEKEVIQNEDADRTQHLLDSINAAINAESADTLKQGDTTKK
jgi:hypothetical protein